MLLGALTAFGSSMSGPSDKIGGLPVEPDPARPFQLAGCCGRASTPRAAALPLCGAPL